MSNTFSVYIPSRNAEFELGKGNWFGIQKNADYRVFKMTEWSLEDLTDFVFYATASCPYTGTISKASARQVAEALLFWAGEDDLIAVDEGDDSKAVAKELGLEFSKGKSVVDNRFKYELDDELTVQDVEDEKKAVLAHYDWETDVFITEYTRRPEEKEFLVAYSKMRTQGRELLVKRLGLNN